MKEQADAEKGPLPVITGRDSSCNTTIVAEPAEDSVDLPTIPPGLSLKAASKDGLLILNFTEEPQHPEDPLSFPWRVKAWLTFIAAAQVLNTALNSSAASGAAPFIHDYFGGGNEALVLTTYLLGYVAGPFLGAPLSEAFGRRPTFIVGGIGFTILTGCCAATQSFTSLLVLRFLCGAFGSIPTTNSGAICSDCWSHKQRGSAMAYYSVATFSGPSLGPLIGAYGSLSGGRIGWRLSFLILAAISLIINLATIVSAPESYAPVILSRIAKQLRSSTGDERIVSRLEYEERESRGTPKLVRFKAETRRIFQTPFIMLFTESIVSATTAFASLVYALIYLQFEAFPLIFDSIHDLGRGPSSLVFLGTLVGAVISVPVQLWYQKRYVKTLQEAGGIPTPEMRLPPCFVGGVGTVLSYLFLGWTGYKSSIPWILPVLSGVPQGISSILIFRSLQTYLLDAYQRNAASALAANVVCRSLAGAVFPLFARTMFERLGVQWACTLLAGLMLLLVPIPFVFERYGAKIRATSRFAPER